MAATRFMDKLTRALTTPSRAFKETPEIAPLFTIHETVEEAPDMRLYTPLESQQRKFCSLVGAMDGASPLFPSSTIGILASAAATIAAMTVYNVASPAQNLDCSAIAESASGTKQTSSMH
jgi:hypothetical protein